MERYKALAVAGGLLVLGGCSSSSNPTGPTDTVAPTVAIVQPTRGATVGVGTVVIQAVATDSVGVTKVAFYDGTSKIGEDATAATGHLYEINWAAIAGVHTLKAVAYDAAGNTDQDTVTVTAAAAGPTTRMTPTVHATRTASPC